MGGGPELTLRDLHQLPSLRRFVELCRANAVLDAILSPDWEYRYFSFNCAWATGEEMASLRDGSGSEHFGLITDAGAFLKVYDLGSPLNTPRLPNTVDWRTRGVPAELRMALEEPAFATERVSVGLWSLTGSGEWRSGKPPNATLLDVPLQFVHLLVDDPAVYANWASEYYELEVRADLVAVVQQMKPLTPQVVRGLNPLASLEALAGDLAEIGFPGAQGTGRG